MANGDGPSGSAEHAEPDSVALPPSTTLVIRTWQEPGHQPGFRARITATPPSGAGMDMLATADPEEVLSAVRQWLRAQPGAGGLH